MRGRAGHPPEQPAPAHNSINRAQLEAALLPAVFLAFCVAFILFYRRLARKAAAELRSRDRAVEDLQLLVRQVQERGPPRGLPRPPGSCHSSLPSLPPGPPSSSVARSEADASETEESEATGSGTQGSEAEAAGAAEDELPTATALAANGLAVLAAPSAN